LSKKGFWQHFAVTVTNGKTKTPIGKGGEREQRGAPSLTTTGQRGKETGLEKRRGLASGANKKKEDKKKTRVKPIRKSEGGRKLEGPDNWRKMVGGSLRNKVGVPRGVKVGVKPRDFLQRNAGAKAWGELKKTKEETREEPQWCCIIPAKLDKRRGTKKEGSGGVQVQKEGKQNKKN